MRGYKLFPSLNKKTFVSYVLLKLLYLLTFVSPKCEQMKLYKDFADFLAGHFVGKMQKLSVNAGFSCPNRDGTVGRGGCTYCNNVSFSPAYCRGSQSVTAQLEEGKRFFGRKYPQMRYLAYFQSYTSTHGSDADRLMALYEEACGVDGVDGVIIGTRPDCMPDALLAKLQKLPWVMVEYGAESAHDVTLERVNRCHTWADTADAVRRTHDAGIPVGLHLINGLPGENEDMILATVDAVNFISFSSYAAPVWPRMWSRVSMMCTVSPPRAMQSCVPGWCAVCAPTSPWSVLCRSRPPNCSSIRAGD